MEPTADAPQETALSPAYTKNCKILPVNRTGGIALEKVSVEAMHLVSALLEALHAGTSEDGREAHIASGAGHQPVLVVVFPVSAIGETVKHAATVAPESRLSQEPVALDEFPWAAEHIRPLESFGLMGWAYLRGATSLRGVVRMMKQHREYLAKLGVSDIPMSESDYHDCWINTTELFREFFSTREGEEHELFLRRGKKPIGPRMDTYSGPRKLDHQLSYSGGPGKG